MTIIYPLPYFLILSPWFMHTKSWCMRRKSLMTERSSHMISMHSPGNIRCMTDPTSNRTNGVMEFRRSNLIMSYSMLVFFRTA